MPLSTQWSSFAGIGIASSLLGDFRLVGGVVRLARFIRPVLWGALATTLIIPTLSSSARAQEDTQRKVKQRVDPLYPELARRMHISGTVKIQVIIAKDGTVRSTKVIGGPP